MSNYVGAQGEFVEAREDGLELGDPISGEVITPDSPWLPEWWKQCRDETWRRGGRWPLVLAGIRVRAAAGIHPNYSLPPPPARSPFNLYEVGVAPPGGGKTTGYDIAKELLPLPETSIREDKDGISPPSGAGVIESFLERPGKNKVEPLNPPAVIFAYDEAEAIEAMAGTLAGKDTLPRLRTAWSGQTLSTTAASEERKRWVSGHRYRACLLVGTQPDIPLPQLTNEATGMLQRLVWSPSTDQDDTDHLVSPRQLADFTWEWEPPSVSEGPMDIPLQEYIVEELADFRRAKHLQDSRAKGLLKPEHEKEADELYMRTLGSAEYHRIDHGEHTNLIRLRLAGVYAALRAPEDFWRIGITFEDWRLAGASMWMSTRAYAQYRAAQEDLAQTAKRKRRAAVQDDARSQTSGRIQREADAIEDATEDAVEYAAKILREVDAAGEVRPTMAQLWNRLGKYRTRLGAVAGSGAEAKELWAVALEAEGMAVVDGSGKYRLGEKGSDSA